MLKPIEKQMLAAGYEALEAGFNPEQIHCALDRSVAGPNKAELVAMTMLRLYLLCNSTVGQA